MWWQLVLIYCRTMHVTKKSCLIVVVCKNSLIHSQSNNTRVINLWYNGLEKKLQQNPTWININLINCERLVRFSLNLISYSNLSLYKLYIWFFLIKSMLDNI